MREVQIPKDSYKQLILVTRWYDAMPLAEETPDFGVGDRFHENVRDFQMQMVDDSTVLTDEDEQYLSYFVTNEDELHAVICNNDGDEVEIVKFVAGE